MSAARQALRAERAALVARAAEERDELAELFRPWDSRLRTTDRAISVVRRIRAFARPLGLAVGAGMAALAFVRPDSIVGWVGAGQLVWQLITGVRRRAGIASESR